MPLVVKLSVETPVNVRQAAEAFGSELRVNLIRYFRENPGPQKSAAEALGTTTSAISQNTRVLVECGVVVVERGPGDGRSRICRVDVARLDELLDALGAFTRGPHD